MSEDRAVELLLKEGYRFQREGRYSDMLGAAQGAVEAARAVGDLGLEIRAAGLEANAHRMLGNFGVSLQRLTRILTMASDSHRREELAQADLTWYIASAYMDWVATARFLPEIGAAELFRVVDAGEAYLRSVGKREWRAGLLIQRAKILDILGRTEEAVAPAEEALALELRNSGAPGYTLSSYRSGLGDLLRRLRRFAEAEKHYRDVLADAGSGPFDRKVAHEGLAYCAIERKNFATARQESEASVRLAEGMGAEALSTALYSLVAVCRASGDRAATRSAAERYLKAARELGSYELYFALREAVDVAIDGGEAAQARAFLDEAEPLAELLDGQSGLQTSREEIARRRNRLEQMEKNS